MTRATWTGWIGMVVAMLTGAGCSELPPDAVTQIRQANRSYRQANYGDTDRHASTAINAYPQHPATAEAYYLRGLARLKSDDRTAARRDFDTALKLTNRKDLEAKLHAQQGHLLFDEGRYQRALGHFRKSAAAGWDEIVVYRLGVTAQRSGRFAEARRALTRLVSKSQGGPYAKSARQKLRWKHDYFSVQCGAYSTSERAYSVAASLQSGGASISVVRDNDGPKPKFIVLAGKYRDFPSAATALRRFQSIVPDAFLVP